MVRSDFEHAAQQRTHRRAHGDGAHRDGKGQEAHVQRAHRHTAQTHHLHDQLNGDQQCQPGEGFDIYVTADLWQRSQAFEILGLVPYSR